MRIISKFKDYYDYVGGMYYDTDDKVIYNRDKITEPSTQHRKYNIIDKHFIAIPDRDRLDFTVDRNWNKPIKRGIGNLYMKTLLVCGIAYPLYCIHKSNNLYNEYKLLDDEGIEFINQCWTVNIDSLTSKKHQALIELSRLINSPVFIFKDQRNHGNNYFRIEHTIEMEVPNLRKLGFNKIKRAEILYQELEYFIGSILPGKPDSLPIPSIPFTDKDKILNAGFDLKQSFRHRK